MVRRSLASALWVLVGLMASFLGALSALVGTGAGRQLVTRVATTAVRQVVDGTVEIGDVGGPLLTGITLRNVRVFDLDTTLVATLPEVDATFNPFGFVAGRFVLLGLDLHEPVINVVQHKNGRLNFQELLRLGRPSSGPRKPSPLIVFRNVRITDGTLILRLQDRNAAIVEGREIDHLDRDGRHRIRRFEHLDAMVARLVVSSPRVHGIHFQLAHLAVTSSDPQFVLTDAKGRVDVVGDSVAVDLANLELPGTKLAGRGSVRWPRDTLLYDLTVHADSATLGDVHFMLPRFPRAAVLRGGVQVRSHSGRLLEVRLDPLDVRYSGGSLTGRLTTMSLADSGLVAVRDGDLVARDFDLDFPRTLVDTLPFYGWLSGHTLADGPIRALALEVDWMFRDSVAGRATSHVSGKGEVNLLDPDGMRFQPFYVTAATIDFRTIRLLAPAITLNGELGAAGTVTGALHNARFAGMLMHRDGQRPPSLINGTMGLDTRTDTIGLYADVRADSLSFDGLRGSFPNLPLHGAVSGPIKLDGTLAVLRSHADLTSPGGAVRVDGVVTLLESRIGVRDLTLQAEEIDLARWAGAGPPSRLSFTVAGSLAQDSGEAPVGALSATLAPSRVVGAEFDTGQAAIRFADGQIQIDSLRIGRPTFLVTGSGALGWQHPAGGRMSFDFTADTLTSLDSLVTWFVGRDTVAKGRGRALRGAARVILTLGGTLDSLAIDVRGTSEGLRWRDWEMPSGRGHFAYDRGPVPGIRFDGALDSLRYGDLAFARASAAGAGTLDSITWFARSHFGEVGEFAAAGRLGRRAQGGGRPPAITAGVDSLSLTLPDGTWRLEHPTEVTVSDSLIAIRALTVRSESDSGRIVAEARVPARGEVNVSVQIDAFPLAGVYALLARDTAGVSGTVNLTVGIAGSRRDPVYVGSIAMNKASFRGFRTPFLDGTLGYRDRRLDAALHLRRSDEPILTVTAHLPLDLSLLPVAERQLPDTLSLRALADSVDLSVLEALTPLVRDVSGVFSADARVQGTWRDPRLGGVVRIEGAAATIPELNVRYENIAGDFGLSGDTILARSVSASSGNGRMDVTGTVRLTELTHPVLALVITGDRFKALDLKGNVTVAASGRVTLTGPVIGATLAGHATVTSGLLYFADLVEKRIVNLEEFSDSALESIIAEQRLGPEFQSVFLDSLRVQDLALIMGNDVWLRSNEANIQLAGTVTFNKERNNYLLSGTLQAPRGVYRLKVGPVTREFVVSEGTVTYFGTPDLDAELNISAKHTVHPLPGPGQSGADIVVVAHITGTLLVPRVTLEAEHQDLSQTEVISYLFFGKPEASYDQGLADQQVIRTAVSVLSGELERTLVSDLGIPLDYVEIRPGASSDPLSGVQFAVGRQLGRKTFVVLNAGFCQGRPVAVTNTVGISLQFRLSPEFRTEASFEPVRQCSSDPLDTQSATLLRQVGLDLIWERRY